MRDPTAFKWSWTTLLAAALVATLLALAATPTTAATLPTSAVAAAAFDSDLPATATDCAHPRDLVATINPIAMNMSVMDRNGGVAARPSAGTKQIFIDPWTAVDKTRWYTTTRLDLNFGLSSSAIDTDARLTNPWAHPSSIDRPRHHQLE